QSARRCLTLSPYTTLFRSLHTTETVEVVRHDALGHGRADAQLLAEAEGGEPVGQAIAGGLDAAAQLRGDLVHGDVENSGSDVVVQVLPRPVGLDEASVLGKVRHDAHLDLRVVGGQQRLVALADAERGADLAA